MYVLCAYVPGIHCMYFGFASQCARLQAEDRCPAATSAAAAAAARKASTVRVSLLPLTRLQHLRALTLGSLPPSPSTRQAKSEGVVLRE